MIALGTMFQTISELASVHRFRGETIDLEVVPMPALYFYENGEDRQRENRQQNGVIHLSISVFLALPLTQGNQDFSDIADIIQARIHGVLFNSSNESQALLGLVKNIQEGPVDKRYPNDTYRVLDLSFIITYGHKFGDAFSTLAR